MTDSQPSSPRPGHPRPGPSLAIAPAPCIDGTALAAPAALGGNAGGDAAAGARPFDGVYAELRSLASRLFREERVHHTLQPTALVHEAWLRLAGQRPEEFQGQAHVLALAARAMRRALVDHARARGRRKRGDGMLPLSLPEVGPALDLGERHPLDVLDLHAALEEFAAVDRRAAELVELRFFAGLTLPEAARNLGLSLRTAEREWTLAKAWLRRRLEDGR